MSTITDDYSPVFQGDTLKSFAPTFQQKVNGVLEPLDLTGATFATRMRNQYDVIKTWNPANWTVDDAAAGRAHYQYQATDVDTAGTWTVQVEVFIGGKAEHADEKTLVILPII